jgi:hypothetical protein
MKRFIIITSIVSVPIYFYVFMYLLHDWMVGVLFVGYFVAGPIFSNAASLMTYLELILLFVFSILGGILTYAFLLWLARLNDQTI